MQIRTAMKSALSYAKHGIGISGKNPSVGCVILNSDMDLVSLGRTGFNGRPHAEKIALESLKSDIKGGIAVITLEPCAHENKIPKSNQDGYHTSYGPPLLFRTLHYCNGNAHDNARGLHQRTRVLSDCILISTPRRMDTSTHPCFKASTRPRVDALTHSLVHASTHRRIHASTRGRVDASRRRRIDASTRRCGPRPGITAASEGLLLHSGSKLRR